MVSRRSFLALLGTAFAAAATVRAGEPGSRRTRWEMIAHSEPPAAPHYKPEPDAWDDNTLTASWIGHATVLINFFGTCIITDPVLSDRIGLDMMGLFTIGPRRLVQPALTLEELPPIDLILLSHAHMDHMDTPTLRKFDRGIPVVIAKNTFDVIENMGFQQVYELDWGEWTQAAGLRVEAMEVKHFGWRYPWEKDRSKGNRDGRSYNAYLLSKNGRHIVFGGDTAYQEYFKALAQRNLAIDLAIMPIGAYDPWIFNHANPEEAVAMADHMGAHTILPIHWNTFIQSEEPTYEPMQRLKAATASQPDRIALESIGQTWVMNARG